MPTQGLKQKKLLNAPKHEKIFMKLSLASGPLNFLVFLPGELDTATACCANELTGGKVNCKTIRITLLLSGYINSR